MGTICILFGLIIFLGSIFLGFAAAQWMLVNLANTFKGIFTSDAQTYAVCVGVCAFIGLLIFLNLLMHGLTYNKLSKHCRHRGH